MSITSSALTKRGKPCSNSKSASLMIIAGCSLLGEKIATAANGAGFTVVTILLRLQGTYVNHCLEGNLSRSLVELKHLRHLNLSFNFFPQSIPSFLGSFPNLEYLSLGHAFYWDFISNGSYSHPEQSLDWLSRLSLLRHLDLSGADLSQVKNWMQIVSQLPSLGVLLMDRCSLPVNIPPLLAYTNSSSDLRIISLSNNFINDRYIFQWLFSLPGITTKLVYLDLSSNLFEGPVPKGFGNLQHLSHLDLSHNQLQVPVLNDFENLQQLSHLDLSNNVLAGPVPNGFGNLQHLSHLDLSYNQLQVPVPNDFKNLQQLSHLDLSNNVLEGPVPNGFENLQHLSHLDLSNNQLEGPIPSEFKSMHSLSYLSLSGNNLQGSDFKIFSGLCNLQQLYLRANNITDELTNVIQALLSCENTALKTLDLSYNRLRGTIPDSISSFSLLKELYLNGNQLNGKITPAVGQLATLEKLDISSNSLEGTLIQTHFLKLSRLRELYLSDNLRLVMNIDASWDPPFQLDVISLRSCKLGPHYPNWLQMQTNFSYLDISNTQISDNISVSFWNSLPSNLQYLNMSYNQFYGLIPNLPKRLQSLSGVDLSSNHFEGAIPSGFTHCFLLYLNDNRFSDAFNVLCPKTTNDLYVIDLSNNLLSGELPDCWMNFDALGSLHLENNRFSGSIPKSIGTLKELEYLHLNNNSFSGLIPASLESCTNLVVLNLGYNSFNGNIPSWIGNGQLAVLILRRNNFHGEIPVSLCQLLTLQILDFAVNHISGVIPRCISNFMAMTTNSDTGLFNIRYTSSLGDRDEDFTNKGHETSIIAWKREEQRFKQSVELVKSIDFSCNELGGEIPHGIYDLTGLLSLDLSKNNLGGSIAPEIGQLAALELLDLSDNHLTGKIPDSLAKVSSLGILDLSNNNLSGKIPLGTQLQSFDASSYTGNLGLCGAPLSKCPGDQAPFNALNGDGSNSVQDEHDAYGLFPGLYISVVLGFIVGFWGVCGTLVIKTSWRHAYFRLLEDVQNRFYEIAIMAQAWRKP